MTDTEGSTAGPRLWFEGREVPVLMYRINRRPREQPTFFSSTPDFFNHLAECLLFGEEIVTGRRDQRIWRLGNRGIDTQRRVLSGRAGWMADTEEEHESYDDVTRSWTEQVAPATRAASAPFAISARTRIVYVAKHPTFSEGTVETVFEALLNLGETCGWSSRPIGLSSRFLMSKSFSVG